MRDDDLSDRSRFPLRPTFALLIVALVAITGLNATRAARDASRNSSGAPNPPPAAHRVDLQAPQIHIASATRRLHPFASYVLRGRVNERARVRVDGKRVPIRGRSFRVRFKLPPTKVSVVAVDEAGNRSRKVVTLHTRYFPVRGVHVSAFAWATPSYRAALMDAIRDRRITTVELDLKDESGTIGYASKVPLALDIGASRDIYDLEETIDRIHRLGARVIGRLVAFRDPVLARASWAQGHHERVIQTRDRQPYAGYGGFTNFTDDVVRHYNQAIALEAAKAGVDDILYDYVRKPDGPLMALRIPGSKGAPEGYIASFVRETTRKVRRFGTRVGVSVYGVAATRPEETGQDVRKLARAADYISPMVYPSHWAPGEYGVGNPNAQPYQIVKRSLRDFLRQTRGTGATVIPWLQDFSLGLGYGRAEVCAQMQAARDVGIEEWLLWDPNVTYTMAPQPRLCSGVAAPLR